MRRRISIYTIEKVFNYLIKVGLSEYGADLLIMQLLSDEDVDFVGLIKKVNYQS